jgi:DNA-binding IclR family transcriptional regulator
MNFEPNTTIRSVEISCEIIETIKKMGSGNISEISDQLDYSNSTIHDHLATLRANQLITREGKRYKLGLQFVSHSQHVKNQWFDFPLIREAVEELGDKTGERARFGSEDYGHLFYIYEVSGDSKIGKRSQSSIQEPLHCTAIGKAILALQPEHRIKEIIEYHGLEQRTPNTITDYDDLMDELEQVRNQKYAIDDEELTMGRRCVAAPVLRDEIAIGALGVSGPASRLEDDRISDELAREVRRVANVIEINSIFST